MVWWNDFLAWFNSTTGSRIFLSAILPFLAILVAGIVAAAIGRGSSRRVLEHQDRELKGAAIMALIVVGRKAAIWSSLGGDEKQHVDSLMSEADIRVRLLPVNGADQAADWAAHELAAMKKNSASFSFQAEQTFFDYRDRMLDWQLRPGRARKLFSADLGQWRYEDDSAATTLVSQQQEWASAHVEPPRPPTASIPVAPSAAHLAATPPPTTAPVGIPAAAPLPRTTADAIADSEALDDSSNPLSPPVTAGTVRRRVSPER